MEPSRFLATPDFAAAQYRSSTFISGRPDDWRLFGLVSYETVRAGWWPRASVCVRERRHSSRRIAKADLSSAANFRSDRLYEPVLSSSA